MLIYKNQGYVLSFLDLCIHIGIRRVYSTVQSLLTQGAADNTTWPWMKQLRSIKV